MEGFGKELFESDLDRISDYVIYLMKWIFVLVNVEIISVVLGFIIYFLDVIFLFGFDVEVFNMWLVFGMGYGIGFVGEWWMFFVLVK